VQPPPTHASGDNVAKSWPAPPAASATSQPSPLLSSLLLSSRAGRAQSAGALGALWNIAFGELN
jgi:hypothetical protein